MDGSWLDIFGRIFGKDDENSSPKGIGRSIETLVERAESNGRTEVMAGSIQMLGLSNVKERLGEKWESVSGRATAIAEEEIDRAIGVDDFCKAVEDGFLICFDSDDHDEASATVERIAKAIEARLISEIVGIEGSQAVRYFTTRIKTDSLRSAVQAGNEPRSAVSRNPPSTTLSNPTKHTGMAFQPTWPAHENGSTKNRCMMDSLAGKIASQHLRSMGDVDTLIAAIADMDRVLLHKCTEAVVLEHTSRQASLIVPIQYRTLSSKHKEDLVDLGRSMPARARKVLLIEVVGVPSSASAREIRSSLRHAGRIADRLLLQLPSFDARIDDETVEMLWGLSWNMADVDQMPWIVQYAKRFCEHASRAGLHTFAFGANTIGKATAARDAGFAHIAGHAVHQTLVEPHGRTRFNPIFGRSNAPGGKTDPSRRGHARFAPSNPNATMLLDDGVRVQCRVLDASCSGVAVTTEHRPSIGSNVKIGKIPGKVARHLSNGFATQFLNVQPVDTLEADLGAIVHEEEIGLSDMARLVR